jgi:hypothetical protein
MRKTLSSLIASTVLLGGIFVFTSPHVLAQGKTKPSAITVKFNAMGGDKGDLGVPSGSEQARPHGGRFRAYQNGAIYWSQRTGVHAVSGAAFEKYKEAGAVTGALGYPVTDVKEMKTGGNEVVFEHGFIMVNQGGVAETTMTPWATFSEHNVIVVAGVKTQKLSANTALLLPLSGPTVTFSCGCKETASMELGTCRISLLGPTVTCMKGTCRSSCVITIVGNQDK